MMICGKIIQRLVLALFVICSFSPVSIANVSVAEVKKVHGVVDVFHKGERKASTVAVGAAISVGDTVRTGRRSRVQLKFNDGSVLNIGSLAKIQVGEFSFDADTKVRKSSIRNLRGKVRAAVSKSSKKESFFRIKTPGAVAAVRGTNFAVDVVSPKKTIVLTFSGAVAVSNLQGPEQNNSVLVRANQVTYVVAKKAPSTPVKAPAQVLRNMASGTKQVESKDSSKAKSKSTLKGEAKGKAKGKAKGSSKTSVKSKKSSSSTPSATSSKSKGSTSTSTGTAPTSSTATKTTGTTTPSGVQTTTTTTTTSASGSTSSVSTTSSVSSGGLVANTASAAPIVAPVPVVAPQVVPPTVPLVVQPVPVVVATPPITTTVPAVVKTNVNVVIQF